jgi:hypothetical protein
LFPGRVGGHNRAGLPYNFSVAAKTDAIVRYLFPRLQDVLFISLLAIVLLSGPRLFNDGGDLGRHLTMGQYILDHGAVPSEDVFLHTMEDTSLIPQEWLAQILLGLAHRLMGLDGPVLLTALIVAGTFLLTYRENMRREVFRMVGLFVALWAAATSSPHWLAGPQVFSLLLAALWTYRLERFRENEVRSAWPFPVLMWVWANTDGAFMAGFAILLIFLVEWYIDFRRGRASKAMGTQLGLIAVTSLLSTLINPASWQIWASGPQHFANHAPSIQTVESLPPNFQSPMTWPFLFMLILALTALAWGKQLRMREGLLIAVFAGMGLYSARNISLFAVVTAPIFADLIQAQARRVQWLANQEKELAEIELHLRGFFWPGLAVLSAAFLLWQHIPLDITRQGNDFSPGAFPVEAANWLEAHPQEGNAFNSFTWGGYLLYRRWPEQKVFIDGQAHLYDQALTQEYETVFMVKPGWKGILNQYGVSWAILPADSELAQALTKAGWASLYKDSTSVILKKP